MKRGATRPLVVTQAIGLRLGVVKILFLEITGTLRVATIAINFDSVSSTFA